MELVLNICRRPHGECLVVIRTGVVKPSEVGVSHPAGFWDGGPGAERHVVGGDIFT